MTAIEATVEALMRSYGITCEPELIMYFSGDTAIDALAEVEFALRGAVYDMDNDAGMLRIIVWAAKDTDAVASYLQEIAQNCNLPTTRLH
jgi:hypothetical protein